MIYCARMFRIIHDGQRLVMEDSRYFQQQKNNT